MTMYDALRLAAYHIRQTQNKDVNTRLSSWILGHEYARKAANEIDPAYYTEAEIYNTLYQYIAEDGSKSNAEIAVRYINEEVAPK